MKKNEILFLIVTLLTTVISQFANAQTKNWKTFNHKYGFRIELPNYFNIGALTNSGIQYYTTELNENIMVYVETIGEGTNGSLAKDFQMEINSTKGIGYKILKDTWFVISGMEEDEIFYMKTIIKNWQTHYLRITYPSSQKEIFDSILPRISKSFR
jgi:hypothetical protein